MNEYLRVKIKVLSFFLVVLVVIVHAYNTNQVTEPTGLYRIYGLNGFIQEYFCQGMNRIASPLFFIISGYLFFVNLTGKRQDFVRKVKKRFITLIVPYLLWSLWGILFYIFLQSALPSTISFSRGHILDYDLGKLLNTFFLDPVPYQLWYVRDLAVFAIISPLLYLLLKYLRVSLLLLCVFIWIYDFDFVVFRNQSLLFFVFGAYISSGAGERINNKSTWITSVYTSLWVLIVLFKTILVYYDYQNLTMLIIIHKISIVAGILAINNLYNIIIVDYTELVRTKLFSFVTFSFFLFASHEPLETVLKKGLLLVLGNGEAMSLIVFLITPVLTIILCVFTGYHLKRLAPKFYGTITGWR
jgi:surface polysaccharide O-acyltransferase-like enzyme